MDNLRGHFPDYEDAHDAVAGRVVLQVLGEAGVDLGQLLAAAGGDVADVVDHGVGEQRVHVRRADLQRRQLLGDGGRRYLLRMYGKYDGSGVFDGYYDNTDVAKKMMNIMGVSK